MTTEHPLDEPMAIALTVTQNLDERCYSLRDFLAVIAAARLARHPLDDVADRLLDMAGA